MPFVNETTRLDVVSSTVMYVGKAAIGASESDPVWKIQKIEMDAGGGLKTLHVDGKSINNSTWANRATYTYS